MVGEVNRIHPAARLAPEEVRFAHAGLLPLDPGQAPAGAEEARLLKRPRVVDAARESGIEGLVSVVGIKYTTGMTVGARAVELAAAEARTRGRSAVRDPAPRSGARQRAGGTDPGARRAARADLRRGSRRDLPRAGRRPFARGAHRPRTSRRRPRRSSTRCARRWRTPSRTSCCAARRSEPSVTRGARRSPPARRSSAPNSGGTRRGASGRSTWSRPHYRRLTGREVA